MTDAAVDVISENVGDHIRREQVRELAASVVQAVFRFAKLSTLHSIDNQAMVRQVEEMVSLIEDFGQRSGYNVSILFAHGSIFVCGQLLKANRSVYEGALELGEILKRCGYSELGIAKDVRPNDFYAFAATLADALRSSKPTLASPVSNIRLRAVGDDVLRREAAIDRIDDAAAAVVRAYATAIVIMRRFYEDLRVGRYVLRQSLKRITQRLVDLSAGETPAFLGVTSLRNQNHDDAGRAVNTAILSLTMARQITSDMVLLQRLAMAALLLDTARPRLTGASAHHLGIIPHLSEQQDADVPAGTGVVLTALGLVNEPSVMRTVMAFEAHWVKRHQKLGPLYRGLRQPTLQARILATARTFNDLLTPEPGQTPLNADEAIAKLEKEALDSADRTVLRLLVGALGIFPTGTLVALSTQEVALVVQTPSHPSHYCRPRVRLVLDATGSPIARPIEIDLAEPPQLGEPARYIQRIVATSDDPSAASMRAHAASQEVVRHQGVTTPNTPTARPPIPTPLHGGPSDLRGPLISHPSSPTIPITPSPMAQQFRTTDEPPASYNARAPTIRPGRVPDHDLQAPPPPRPPAPGDSFLPPRGDDEVVKYDDVHAQATRAVSWEDQDFLLQLTEGPDELEGRPSAIPGNGTVLKIPSDPPTAEGTLARTPLVHLLVYMLDKRLTGTTCLLTPQGLRHGIFFNDGVPAKIQTGSIIAPLDRVVLDLGLLDEAALSDTLREISKRRILHGRLLVSRGLLDRETVVSVLREQLVRKLIALFDLPAETRYAYYDQVNLLATYGGPELFECEPLSVIMAGVRLRADDPAIDATLERLAGRPLGLHLEAEMKRFRLHRDEAAVVDLLRTRRMTLDEMIRAGAAQQRIVKITVYALAITRHLDLGTPGRPPVGLSRDRPPVAEPTQVVIRDAHETHRGSVSDRTTSPVVPTWADPRSPTSPRTLESAGQRTPPAASGERRSGKTTARSVDHEAPIVTPPTHASDPSPKPSATVQAKSSTSHNVMGGRQVTMASPMQPQPEIAARRTEIEQRADTIDADDYFSVLGVQDDATPEQIQAAYFALAKQWHPDRTPPELEDVKDKVAHVFARISEAYRTLSDVTRRSEYIKALQHGESTEDAEQVARAMSAAIEFQKAEALLKKHDLEGAEVFARRAVHSDPIQPEYQTLLVWIQAQRRGEPPTLAEGATTSHYDDLIESLDAVLDKEPEYERALYYRGLLLKRAGKTDKALRDFRLAAEINPKNLDAVREVRLHEMRSRTESPSAGVKNPSFLGKLFKR